tara:strand:- start:3197 stop:3655 length:459 start_codon:yes stop_codon:yes gene_type:complete
MNNLFQLTDKIKEELESNAIINAVSFGDLFDLEFEKMSVFPMAHVGMTTARMGAGVLYVDMSILFLDQVDESKSAQSDNYYGNDNEHYVLNNMLAAATKTVQELMRGDLFREGFQVDDETIEVDFFSERFKEKLAGCGINFTVTIKNTLDLC